MTEVHFRGSSTAISKDLDNLAKKTRVAYDRLRQDELAPEGAKAFVDTLDKLKPLYTQASTAKEAKDPKSFSRALRKARPLDRKLDRITEAAGLRKCGLGEPREDEKRFDVRGFPTFNVPASADEERIVKGKRSATLPLSKKTALIVSRGPKTKRGRVNTKYAAFYYRRSSYAAYKAKNKGKAGREPVPFGRYAFRGPKLRGTQYVFSGQGNLWVLFCATRGKKEPKELESTCRRAARTMGFFIY